MDEDDLAPRRPRWLIRGIALLAVLLLLTNLGRIVILRDPEPQRSPVPLPTRTEPTASPSGSPTAAKPLAGLPVEIRRLAKRVEQMRGLRFLEPVDVEIVSPAKLDRRLEAAVEKALDPVDIARTGRTWKALGLMPADGDLMEAIMSLNTGGVAGFYDDETEELVVGTRTPDSLSAAARYYVVHELTHALTDQHFGLEELHGDRPGSGDAASAFRALVEGDAVIIAERYRRSFSSSDESSFQSEQSSRDRSALSRVPGAMLAGFSFPYTYGPPFVTRLVDRGGYERLDRAYRKPPRSTSEILHPETFPARSPVKLGLPELPEGWRKLEADAFGELDLKIVLERDPRDPSVSSSQASEAAEGWTGGRFRTSGSEGHTAVEISLAFADPAEAQEAAEAFDRNLRDRTGSDRSAFSEGDWVGWSSEEVAGALLLDGNRLDVLIASDVDGLRIHARG